MSGLAVLGSGAYGTALASMLASQTCPVTLWGRDVGVVEHINTQRRNPSYLGDIPLSSHLTATTDLDQACQADTVLCVTPAQTFADLLQNLHPRADNIEHLVLCAKGIDQTSGRLMHEIATDVFQPNQVAALSGPSFATDVARGLPTAVSLAASNQKVAEQLSAFLARPRFRIYATDDLTGVEIGGALKNVLALAVGIARGLELGASAEAALIARGFAELNRVALALGARPETLAGLSGLGDLVLTCSSPQSRNFSYGIALARQEDLTSRPLAEGVHSAGMALQTALKLAVDAPIIECVVAVLSGKILPLEAVSLLLARPLKTEN